jgi:hypothetical protein
VYTRSDLNCPYIDSGSMVVSTLSDSDLKAQLAGAARSKADDVMAPHRAGFAAVERALLPLLKADPKVSVAFVPEAKDGVRPAWFANTPTVAFVPNSAIVLAAIPPVPAAGTAIFSLRPAVIEPKPTFLALLLPYLKERHSLTVQCGTLYVSVCEEHRTGSVHQHNGVLRERSCNCAVGGRQAKGFMLQWAGASGGYAMM